MIPYAIYKLVHFLGLFVSMAVLATVSLHVLAGGTRATNPHRRVVALVHGVAVFLVLLGGFGMLARLGIVQGGLPTWILVKLTLWGVLAVAVTLAYRGATLSRLVLIGAPLLGVLGGATALYKPFQ